MVCHIITWSFVCVVTLHLLQASFPSMHHVLSCRCGQATFAAHPSFTLHPQSSHSQQRNAPRAGLMASVTASAVQGLQQRRAANALLEPFSQQAASTGRAHGVAQWLPAPMAWVAGAVAQTLQQRQSVARTEQAALQRRAGEAWRVPALVEGRGQVLWHRSRSCSSGLAPRRQSRRPRGGNRVISAVSVGACSSRLVMHGCKLSSGRASVLVEKQTPCALCMQAKESLWWSAAGFRSLALLCQTTSQDCRTGACCRTRPLPSRTISSNMASPPPCCLSKP